MAWYFTCSNVLSYVLETMHSVDFRTSLKCELSLPPTDATPTGQRRGDENQSVGHIVDDADMTKTRRKVENIMSDQL